MSVKNNLTNLNEALYLVNMLKKQLEQIIPQGSISAYVDASNLLYEIEAKLDILKRAEPKPDLAKMS